MENSTGQSHVKCPKCGFSNSSNLKYCGNCGARLLQPRTGRTLQSLSLLLIATSLYLVISILSDRVVQSYILILAGYLVSALLGSYVGYQILQERSGKGLVVAAAASITTGFVFSFTLYLVGLSAGGVVGPVWIFFVVMAWLLLKSRREI
jgi:hypothetical protein